MALYWVGAYCSSLCVFCWRFFFFFGQFLNHLILITNMLPILLFYAPFFPVLFIYFYGWLNQNTLLTRLFPDSGVLDKWGGEGTLLELCIKKWEERAAAQWTWGTQQQRNRDTEIEHYAIAMQAAVHSVWPWGLQKIKKQRDRQSERTKRSTLQ